MNEPVSPRPPRSVRTPEGSSGWVVAHLRGAPVVVAPSSLVLAALVVGSWYPVVATVLERARASGAQVPAWAPVAVIASAVAVLAVSVTLHELAHGVVGTLCGRTVERYELYVWGGRTTFRHGPTSPWQDLAVSLAGPLTNLVCAGVGWWVLMPATDGVMTGLIVWAGTWMNLALGVLNVLPALPLDGGHALAALVTGASRRRDLGVTVAAGSGVLVVLALVWRWLLAPVWHSGQRPDAMRLIVVVMVAWPLAQASWHVLGRSWRARRLAAFDLRGLCRPVAVLPASSPLEAVRQALDDGAAVVLLRGPDAAVSWVDRHGLEQVPAGSTAPAGAVGQVLAAACVTAEVTGARAQDALRQARRHGAWLVVVDGGAVYGAVPTGQAARR